MAEWHRRFLRTVTQALPCDTFEVRVIALDRKPVAVRTFTPAQFIDAAEWMAHQSAQHRHVFMRPVGPITHVLVDDLTPDALHLMACDGITPSLVVETSVDSLQAWVSLPGRWHADDVHRAAARLLAVRYSADMGSAKPAQFGRVPTTRNCKPERAQSDGTPPLVLVRRAAFTMSRRLLAEAEAVADAHPSAPQAGRTCLADAGDGAQDGADDWSRVLMSMSAPLEVHDRGRHVVRMAGTGGDPRAFWHGWPVKAATKADGEMDRSATDVRRAVSMLRSGVPVALVRAAMLAGSEKVSSATNSARAEALVESAMSSAMAFVNGEVTT